MRYTLSILCCIAGIVLLGYSNSSRSYTKSSEIRPVLAKYLERLEKEGIYTKNLDSLKLVEFVPDSFISVFYGRPAHAITYQDDQGYYKIAISFSSYFYNPEWFLEAIIYHEMFHVLFGPTSGHCDYEGCPPILNYYVDPASIEWDDGVKEEYFEFLKGFFVQ